MIREINTIELHRAFAHTEYGETLAGMVRYERYMPEGTPNDEWVALLGADVNNLEHMRLTTGLTHAFIRSMDELSPGELTEEDRELLPVAAISHDWGEAIVSDITFSHKTLEDEKKEKKAFLSIVSGSLADVSGSELVVQAAHEVVFDQKKTRRGRMFNAVERVGYMRTALRAHARVETVSDPELVNGLRWIVADVLGNQLVPLVEAAEQLPPIRQYLMHQGERISTAFDSIDDAVFSNYTDAEEETKRLAVAQSHAVWHTWAEKQGL